MLQLEELGAAHDVVGVGVREGHDVEVVTPGGLQLLLEPLLEIDLGCVRAFGVRAVAEVEQDAAPLAEDNLRCVAVAHRIEEDLVPDRHVNL